MINLTSLEQITPILVIAITVIVVIILGMLVAILVLQNIVSGYFSSKKFAVKSKHKVEPLTGEEKFELMVFNNNVNEARILSFGFLYRSNSVDFFDTYLDRADLKKEGKILIDSRDFIKLEIEAKHLQEIIARHNDGRVRVAPVQAYVTDVSGNIIKYGAREVRRIIYRHFKALDDVRKADEKAQKLAAKQAQKQERAAARAASLAAFKAKFAGKPKQTETAKAPTKPKSEPASEEKSE